MTSESKKQNSLCPPSTSHAHRSTLTVIFFPFLFYCDFISFIFVIVVEVQLSPLPDGNFLTGELGLFLSGASVCEAPGRLVLPQQPTTCFSHVTRGVGHLFTAVW